MLLAVAVWAGEGQGVAVDLAGKVGGGVAVDTGVGLAVGLAVGVDRVALAGGSWWFGVTSSSISDSGCNVLSVVTWTLLVVLQQPIM